MDYSNVSDREVEKALETIPNFCSKNVPIEYAVELHNFRRDPDRLRHHDQGTIFVITRFMPYHVMVCEECAGVYRTTQQLEAEVEEAESGDDTVLLSYASSQIQ